MEGHDVSTRSREAVGPFAGRREDPTRGAARHAAGPREVGFGDYLRELCAGLAGTLARPGGPTLACAAADAALPVEAAVRLGLVADELVTNAFEHAFPAGRGGRGGRIVVSFTAAPDAWRLTVEDSGVGLARGGDPGRGAGLAIARRLVGELAGRLELPDVIGGARCLALAPRDRFSRPCRTIDPTEGPSTADPG
jgi:two-component sensor histidine kinase